MRLNLPILKHVYLLSSRYVWRSAAETAKLRSCLLGLGCFPKVNSTIYKPLLKLKHVLILSSNQQCINFYRLNISEITAVSNKSRQQSRSVFREHYEEIIHEQNKSVLFPVSSFFTTSTLGVIMWGKALFLNVKMICLSCLCRLQRSKWFRPSPHTHTRWASEWIGCYNSCYHVSDVWEMLMGALKERDQHYFPCVCVHITSQSCLWYYIFIIFAKANFLLCVTDASVGHSRSGEVSHDHPELLPQRSWRHHRLRHHTTLDLWLGDSLDQGGGALWGEQRGAGSNRWVWVWDVTSGTIKCNNTNHLEVFCLHHSALFVSIQVTNVTLSRNVRCCLMKPACWRRREAY